MHALIIEDDPKKSGEIRSLLGSIAASLHVLESRSYQSGVRQMLENLPGLVLLDMSMPTFDRTSSEKGGKTRPYGGRDVLREMRRRQLKSRVIIVTGFETFGDPGHQKSLDELSVELSRDFADLYVGTVYYHPSRSEWRDRLGRLILQALAPS